MPGNNCLRVILLVSLLCSSCAPLSRPEEGKTAMGRSSSEQGVGGEGETTLLGRYLQGRQSSADSTGTDKPHIAVLPFNDDSGFRKDVWDLEQEMARLLSKQMAAFAEWQVVPCEVVEEVVGKNRRLKPSQAVEFGRILKADIALLGTILDYNMGRFSVGDPLLGGYKSYTGVAKLKLLALRVEDQSEIGVVEAERELVDRDLGLDLLGKPREQDLQFVNLKDLPFGSEGFRQTVLGQATLEVVDELLQKLANLIRPQPLELEGQPAEILSVSGTEVYVNVGSENGLQRGYRFAVFPGARRVREEGADPQQRIGVVAVAEVIGARLSKVRILEGGEEIKPGDRLQLLSSTE